MLLSLLCRKGRGSAKLNNSPKSHRVISGRSRVETEAVWGQHLCSLLCFPPGSWGCHNRVPPTAGLATDLFLQFWRPEIPNQGLSRAMLPPKVLGKNPSWPPSLWWLLAILGVPWLHDLCLSSHMALVPVCVSKSPPQDTSQLGL